MTRNFDRTLKPWWFIKVWCKIAFYERAQREMSPAHPDAPRVTLRLRELYDERAALFN